MDCLIVVHKCLRHKSPHQVCCVSRKGRDEGFLQLDFLDSDLRFLITVEVMHTVVLIIEHFECIALLAVEFDGQIDDFVETVDTVVVN